MFDSILFDLDGTLWDAVPEIAQSWSLALSQKGICRPPVTTEELRPCMGMLLPDIAARLFPQLPRERQLEVINHCCASENDYLAQHGAALYPDAEDVLCALSKKYTLFVVSNCQDGYIQAFFQGTGMGKYFSGFECAGRTGKSKSENISLVMERHGLKNSVYLGDTALDQQSATEAGIPFIHAAYGFGKAEKAPAVQSLRELPELLEKLGAGAGQFQELL